MEDVTGLLNQYREAARIIWNNFLRDEEAYYDVTNELTCDFNAIKRLLFIAIVLRRFGVENHLPPEFTGEEAALLFLGQPDHVPSRGARAGELACYDQPRRRCPCWLLGCSRQPHRS